MYFEQKQKKKKANIIRTVIDCAHHTGLEFSCVSNLWPLELNLQNHSLIKKQPD